ncbi:hypothetical protein G6F59_014741 [Rhizopus arrhizus]|nr:hypothetical protein G6F59_014741 [Rhizopus arrhizus]
MHRDPAPQPPPGPHGPLRRNGGSQGPDPAGLHQRDQPLAHRGAVRRRAGVPDHEPAVLRRPAAGGPSALHRGHGPQFHRREQGARAGGQGRTSAPGIPDRRRRQPDDGSGRPFHRPARRPASFRRSQGLRAGTGGRTAGRRPVWRRHDPARTPAHRRGDEQHVRAAAGSAGGLQHRLANDGSRRVHRLPARMQAATGRGIRAVSGRIRSPQPGGECRFGGIR